MTFALRVRFSVELVWVTVMVEVGGLREKVSVVEFVRVWFS